MSNDKPGTGDDTRPDDETRPVRPEGGTELPPAPAAAPAAEGPAAAEPAYAAGPAPVARRGFRERMRSLRSADGNRSFGLAALIASALAGIIVGGLGATALQAVGDDHDRGGRMDRMEQRGQIGRDRDGDRGGRGPFGGGLPGAPGLQGQGQGQGQTAVPPGDDDSFNG